MTEKYGCILAKLKTSRKFDEIKELIDEGDLSDNGIEHETHVTLLYGLHAGVTLDQVKTALDGINVMEVEITGISLFENTEDVLKFDVRASKGLLSVRDALMALPNTQSYPDYKPHITIAYLKSGCGKKYLPSKPFNYSLKVTELIYSYPNRTKQEQLYESIKKNKL